MQSDRTAADLYHLVHRLGKIFRTIDAGSGLPSAQLSALVTVVMHGPMPMTAVAAYELVTPQSISRVVDDLETRGLVRRRPDAADRRRALVEATTAGQRLALAARQQKIDFLADFVSGRSASNQRVIERAVAALEPVLEHGRPGDGHATTGRRAAPG